MASTVADVMTRNPATVGMDQPIAEAARRMKTVNAGDVIVLDNTGRVAGIVTDRDITLRVVAEGRDPERTATREVCTQTGLITIAPDTTTDTAVQLIRERHIRRLPVVDKGRPVGVISLGDLARALDPSSTLAEVSAAQR
ncbi:putative signal-transduction protein with CBS domains [Parafrankia sp. EAN1pec]|uniref:CBS domain-containing protein n=1 Tax=Parafrankia sp. (strain EAN1pec) TaxID=298653 RepID=UPI00005402F9|nr:putative signal-transduction protein with CBS domains [Frankia sp. EAN1pec]